eukprot:3682200-Alexandrium_andersonii.AAC.1
MDLTTLKSHDAVGSSYQCRTIGKRMHRSLLFHTHCACSRIAKATRALEHETAAQVNVCYDGTSTALTLVSTLLVDLCALR